MYILTVFASVFSTTILLTSDVFLYMVLKSFDVVIPLRVNVILSSDLKDFFTFALLSDLKIILYPSSPFSSTTEFKKFEFAKAKFIVMVVIIVSISNNFFSIIPQSSYITTLASIYEYDINHWIYINKPLE